MAISLLKKQACSRAVVNISSSRVLNSIWSRGFLFVTPALFLFAYILGGASNLESIPLCGIRFATGIRCPGCGLTSSFAALSRGRVRESIDLHPLGILIALFFVYMFTRDLFEVFSDKSVPDLLSDRGRQIVSLLFLIAILFQWIFHLILAAC